MVRTSSHPFTVVGSYHAVARLTVTMAPGGVLGVHGELDLATAPLLEQALCTGRPPYGADLTVDLSDLGFCSCAGLSVLLVEHRRLRAAGSRLLLVAPTDGMRRLLRMTGLDAVFDIVAGAAVPSPSRRSGHRAAGGSAVPLGAADAPGVGRWRYQLAGGGGGRRRRTRFTAWPQTRSCRARS